MKHIFLIFLTCFGALSCAHQSEELVKYRQSEAGVAHQMFPGTIEKVTPVYIEGDGGGGSFIGSLLGFIGGSAIGESSGSDVAALGLGIGGAIAGDRIGKKATSHDGVSLVVHTNAGNRFTVVEKSSEIVKYYPGDSVWLLRDGRRTRIAQR